MIWIYWFAVGVVLMAFVLYLIANFKSKNKIVNKASELINLTYNHIEEQVAGEVIKAMCEKFDKKSVEWVKKNEPKLVAKRLIGDPTIYAFRIRKNDLEPYCTGKIKRSYLEIVLYNKLPQYIKSKGYQIVGTNGANWYDEEEVKNPTVIRIDVKI